MDFYALNETPINGWATVRGQATVALALDASGVGAVSVLGAGSVNLELLATGNGTRVAVGAADVQLELSGGGEGRTTQSVGARLALQLSFSKALGGKLVFGQATLAMEIGIGGNGHRGRGQFGEGNLNLSLDFPRADSRKYRNVYGSAEMAFALTMDTRDIRIAALPSVVYPAPRARVATVGREQRSMRVAASERTYEVAEA